LGFKNKEKDFVFYVFIFVLLGKNIGRQNATQVHEQKA